MRKKALRILGATGAAIGLMSLLPSVVHAQDPDPVIVLGQQINLLWIIIGAALELIDHLPKFSLQTIPTC